MIVVTGAGGQLGREVQEACERRGLQVQGLRSGELDLRDAGSVERVLQALVPTVIINTAAYTAVDRAESEPARAFAVNAEGVANLARAARPIDATILHLSTDYVFDGESSRAWVETDLPAPLSVYGESKLEGERALQQSGANYRILRIAWVFGQYGHNFVKTMVRLGRERPSLQIVDDQHGAPMSAEDIAARLVDWASELLTANAAGSAARAAPRPLSADGTPADAWPGPIHHFRALPETTWYGFACEIFRVAVEEGLLTRAPDVRPIPTTAYPTAARRPQRSWLDSIHSAEAAPPCDWRPALRRVLQQLRQQGF